MYKIMNRNNLDYNPSKYPKIKVGQIGTKHAHATLKMETLRELSDIYEIVGIVENDPEQKLKVIDHPAYLDVVWMTEDQLLNSPDLQLVIIEEDLPNQIGTGLRCLEAGKHIHIDKPGVYESFNECKQLHEYAIKHNLIAQIGYFWRYNPAFNHMFNIMEKGLLGEIREINIFAGKNYLDYSSLREALLEYPGGGMHELGCMMVDALITVMGKPISVTAFNRKTHLEIDELSDNQLAILEYPDTVATIRCNHTDPLGFTRREFTIVGELGTATIRPVEPAEIEIALVDDASGYANQFKTIALPEISGRLDGDLIDIAQVIIGEKELTWDANHEIVVHETVLKACGLDIY